MIRHFDRLMRNELIIAVDFDGCLCEHKFPDIGAPDVTLIFKLIDLRNLGNKLILWTCRRGPQLQAAIDWCDSFGLRFDSINENVESEFSNLANEPWPVSHKVYAHLYLDDKAITPDQLLITLAEAGR